jgi:long-chain acyl-CoA synthetase
MLDKNLIKLFEHNFRENSELPALTDYFKKETFTYFDLAQDIAKIHLLFKEAGIERGDKIALIGRNNTRWCVSYLATVTYGAVIVPILQDFNPNDVINIVNHSESKLLFLGDNFWDDIEGDQIPAIDAVFSLTDYHVIYEKEGDKLTNYMKNILQNKAGKITRNGWASTLHPWRRIRA